MSPLGLLALASAGFVGTHFLMSHPLRAALVARFGPGGFALPDGFALAVGTSIWLAATWAHGACGFQRAGIFHFFT